MSSLYFRSNHVFKELRDGGWIHTSIGRRKATKAICRVLEIPSFGQTALPKHNFPQVHPLLTEGFTYSETYINQAFGVLKYLRGDYIGKD